MNFYFYAHVARRWNCLSKYIMSHTFVGMIQINNLTQHVYFKVNNFLWNIFAYETLISGWQNTVTRWFFTLVDCNIIISILHLFLLMNSCAFFRRYEREVKKHIIQWQIVYKRCYVAYIYCINIYTPMLLFGNSCLTLNVSQYWKSRK